ncbi:MAG TPA: hypothetical protein VMM37_08715 [Bacteroidota bacterium]|nr:hypothetical protein [Bacteroidota bacterium]
MGKLLRTIFGINTNQPSLDPTKFGDPLALKIEWTPATRGGANFRTHRFVQIEYSRVEFRASAGAKLFYLFFGGMGLLCSVGFSIQHRAVLLLSFSNIIPVLVGLLFVVVGGALFWTGTTPIVFDKGVGYFWKSRKSPQDVLEVSSLKKCARLDQIHAVQLISEWVQGSKTSYYSYEINLVLGDGRRMTVIDHGNLKWIREDAGKLSEFLGKPVWDAINR